MRVFGRNFLFGEPCQVDIVIFDECNSQFVRRVLDSKYSVGVFKMRPYDFLVSFSIVKNCILCIRHFSLCETLKYKRGFILGVLFQLRSIYFEACLVTMKPKAVVTMIDNSATFHWLSKHSRRFPYIAIQNGSRLRYAVSEDQGFYLQHYFCWGTLESRVYEELGITVENYYPVGSLLGSVYFKRDTDNSINTKYDLLIVSSWRGNIGYPIDVVDTMRSMKVMDKLLSQYITERPLKSAVILRTERDSEDWIMSGIGSEYDYYRSIYGYSIDIIEADFASRSIYSTMQESRLIISCLSSALNEAYGIGKKILYFNYTGKKIYHCDFDSKCVIEEIDFSKVVQIIDELLNQSDNEYHIIHLENIKAVMSYPEDAPTYEKIKSKIDEIIDQNNLPIKI